MNWSVADRELRNRLIELGIWDKLLDVRHRADVLGRITTGILGHWFQDYLVRWLGDNGIISLDDSAKQVPYDLLCNDITAQAKVTSNPTSLNLMRNGHNFQYHADEWQVLACMPLSEKTPYFIPVEALLDPDDPTRVVKSIRFDKYAKCRGDVSAFTDPDRVAKGLAIQAAIAHAAAEAARKKAEAKIAAEERRWMIRRGLESQDMFDDLEQKVA